MRAIHLTYHEITGDPRVMKECLSLAGAGIDVTVICARLQDAPEREMLGNLDVRRIEWDAFGNLTKELVEQTSEMKRSHEFLRERLEPLLEQNRLLEVQRNPVGPLSKLLEYKKYTGFERIYRKYRARGEIALLRHSARSPERSRRFRRFARTGLSKDAFLKVTGKNWRPIRSGDLYQAVSILFDANVRQLDIEGPADIVHAHDIYTLPAGVALARRFGARLVYDAHEYEIERASKGPPEGNAMVDALELDCLEHVDALVTVSDGLKELYARRFERREPVVVFNSPDIPARPRSAEDIERDRANFRSKLGVGGDVPLVAFTGWVQRENRGLDKVVEALALMPEFHLAVIGPRHQSNDAWLLRKARRAGVAERLHLLDAVHHTKVVQTIGACDVSIIPIQDVTLSYRHSMPNKLFEGVFSGLPVCVSNLPDMRRFIEETGRGRTIEQDDPKSIAETLAYLHANRADFAMSEDERIALHERYGWDAQARKLEKLYAELTERS